MKTLRYMLVFLALAYGLVTQAATLNERMTAIQNASGVIAAKLVGTPELVNETPVIHLGKVQYWVVDGDTVKGNTAAIIIRFYNGQGGTEEAFWLERLPDVLQPNPAATTYFTSRNTPYTAAQIEAYCNSLWVAANPTAGPILEFAVQAVNGKTVKVSGKFDTGSATRQDRSYYIWLVDPNGSVATGNANVKFERITTVATP